MKKFVLVATISLFSFSANAQDSVYVDLSVLDSLGPVTDSIKTSPLFPPYKKSSDKKVEKIEKKNKKPVIKKLEVVEETKPVVENIAPVKDVKPVITAPTLEKAEVKEVVSPSVAEPMAEKIETQKETKAQPEVPVEAQAEAKSDTVSEPVVSQEKVKTQEPEINNITFAEGQTKLDDAQKTKIDGILNKFSVTENKIEIISYNTQTGKDVFKKRRESLDRAISVRDYLLEKGFSSYSVQVLNAPDKQDKSNTVELNEVK